MKPLIKPKCLQQGDKIAVVSPCNGWAGDPDILWKYNLGGSRLQKLGLEVIAAPNTLKGCRKIQEHEPKILCGLLKIKISMRLFAVSAAMTA